MNEGKLARNIYLWTLGDSKGTKKCRRMLRMDRMLLNGDRMTDRNREDIYIDR